MDIKKLKELYEQYKQIKGMADGGKVEHDKKNLKTLESAFHKFIVEEGKEPKKYSDGGKVEDKDEDGPSISKDIVDTFKKAFNPSPEPSPSPKDETLEDKYAKIRQQNKKNFGYAEGGEVEDPGLSPEEFQKHLKDLQDQGYHLQNVSGDDQTITVKPKMDLPESEEAPASEEDLSAENPDDKAVEDQMQNEELRGQMEADKGEEPKTDKSEENEPQIDQSAQSLPKSDESAQPEPDQSSFNRLLASVKPEASQSPNALADAQRQRDLNLAYNQIERGSAIAGAGMAGNNVNPNLVLDAIKDKQKYAGLPVEKYNELVANQQNDPNSDMSKVVRDYMSSKGLQIPPSASASDLFKVAPFLQKDQALQSSLQRTLLGIQGRKEVASSNQSAMDKRAAEKNKIEKQKADAATEAAKGNKEQKAETAKDKTLAQTKQMLESARGNPAAAQAEKDLYAVDKVNSLLKIYPDPNKMPEAQVNLLISEIGKIATGGVPTGHEIDALKPGSAEGKLQNLFSKLTNKPTPANAAAYLKEFKKYNDALTGDAQKVLKEKYGRIIESSKKQLGDDNYKSLHDQYLNRFDKSEAPAVDADLSKMSPDELKSYIKAHGA